jgi:hypothetical protein
VAGFEPTKEIKSRLKYNDAETFTSKRVGINNLPSPNNLARDKALSTMGLSKHLKEHMSMDQDDFNSKFRHLSKRVEEEDSKTIMTGKWKETEQYLKNNIEINEKNLKLEISKFKAKHEEA